MLDFSKLKYKIRETPIAQLFTEHPGLEQIYFESQVTFGSQPLHAPLSPQEIMAFVVYAYDLGSPLVREASIHKRRNQSLGLIGHVVATEADFKGRPELVQFMVGSNEFVNRVALHYCKLQNSFDWMELCSLQDILDDVDITLKSESEGTEKKSANEMLKIKLEIREKSKKTRDEMRGIATNLFMSDTHLLDYTASQLILEKRVPVITPERWAESKRKAA